MYSAMFSPSCMHACCCTADRLRARLLLGSLAGGAAAGALSTARLGTACALRRVARHASERLSEAVFMT